MERSAALDLSWGNRLKLSTSCSWMIRLEVSHIRNLWHQNGTSSSRFRTIFWCITSFIIFFLLESGSSVEQVFTFCITNGCPYNNTRFSCFISLDFINNSLLKCIFFIELIFLLGKCLYDVTLIKTSGKNGPQLMKNPCRFKMFHF